MQLKCRNTAAYIYLLTFALTLSCQSTSRAEDHVELPEVMYDGRKITILDLTGSDYIKLADTYGSIVRSFPFSNYRPLGQRFYPPARKPLPDTELRGYYLQHQLDGALESFLGEQVFIAFQRQYSPQRVSIPRNVEDIIAQSAHLNQLYVQSLAEGFREHKSDLEIANTLHDRIARSPFGVVDWNRYVALARDRCPYIVIQSACFPYEINGRPSPWYKANQLAATLPAMIKLEAEKQPKKYAGLVDSQFGRRYAIYVSTRQLIDVPTVKSFAEFALGGSGKGDPARINIANEMLALLDADARISLSFGAQDNLCAMYGLLKEKLIPGTVIEVVNAKVHRGYLYLSTAKPEAAFQSYPLTPGNFGFDAAHDDLLRSVVRSVLGKTLVSEPWHLPSEAELLSRVSMDNLDLRLYGIDLSGSGDKK